MRWNNRLHPGDGHMDRRGTNYMNIESLIILVLQEIWRPLIFETFIWKINKPLSYLNQWCFGFFCYRRWNYTLSIWWASLVVQRVKNPLAMQETWIWSLSWEDPLEEGMATHSSILLKNPHGQRSLAVHGVTESDTNEQLSTHMRTHTYMTHTCRNLMQHPKVS